MPTTRRPTPRRAFAGEQVGMTYSRLQNPTVEMLEQRIALMEGAEAARCTASGWRR
jgi:O-succinylhomoserine sulfhydrylase